MTTFNITHEHPDLSSPEDECQEEIELEYEYEPGDSNYGADADGNRGISIPGSFGWTGDLPEKCLLCGHVYTADDHKEMEKSANQSCEAYEPDLDGPEPDEDDYEDYRIARRWS